MSPVFIFIKQSNLPTDPIEYILLIFPLYRWRHWSTESWSNLPKVTQLVSSLNPPDLSSPASEELQSLLTELLHCTEAIVVSRLCSVWCQGCVVQDPVLSGAPSPPRPPDISVESMESVNSLRTSGLEDLSDFPAFTFSLHVTNAAAWIPALIPQPKGAF